MALIKRMVIILALLAVPLLGVLLFTYDIIKIEWLSTMEIQESYQAQENPLPMPDRSVPIQGVAFSGDAAQAENPVPASENSLARGQYFYEINCAICHGAGGNPQGASPLMPYFRERPPANLLGEPALSRTDGEIFQIITDGIEGAMPSLKQNLPDAEMRWSVVNYVRQLQAAGE